MTGVVVGIAVRGTPAPAPPRPPAVSTATVVRTDLDSTVLTAGTLGYAPTNPLINRVAGTYTALPTVGTRIGPGQDLYRVDNLPVVLMTGTVPAWRPFAVGMTDGPDVEQLEANLIALGDAHGLLSVASDHFGAGTVEAVKRWQSAKGYTANGAMALGVVAFFPAAVLVGAPNVALGQVAAPGDMPYAVSASEPYRHCAVDTERPHRGRGAGSVHRHAVERINARQGHRRRPRARIERRSRLERFDVPGVHRLDGDS